MRKFLILIFGFGFSFTFTSCQPVKGALSSSLIDAPHEITDSFPLFCSENEDVYENKVLFLMDQTKTNKQSDLHRIIRKHGVLEFIKQNNTSNVSYGIIAFSNKIFSPLTLRNTQSEHSVSAFTSDIDAFEQSLEEVLSEDRADKGSGDTDFLKEVLNKVENSVDYDGRINQGKIVDYHIVFVSDGGLFISRAQKKRNFEKRKYFENRIKSINDKLNRVTLHTVYYGNYTNTPTGAGRVLGNVSRGILRAGIYYTTGIPPFMYSDPHSVEKASSEQETDDVRHMRNIANKGGGVYVDQNQNVNWELDLSQEWNTNSFVVYNLNAGFCSDGHVGLDSDMDGLCDKDEKRNSHLGFRPDNRFSINDGFGDYFYWLIYKEGESIELPVCPEEDQEDRDHDLLTACEENFINSIASDRHPSSLVQLDINNPDSDKDGILDGIEVLVYLSTNKLAARDPYNLDETSDGLTEYQKIVKHISPLVPMEDQILYDTSLLHEKGENGTCHFLKQEKLPLYSTLPVDKNDTLSQISQNQGDNTLLVYTIKRSKNNKPSIYQFMYRSIQNNFDSLSLPAEDASFQYLAFTHSSGN